MARKFRNKAAMETMNKFAKEYSGVILLFVAILFSGLLTTAGVVYVRDKELAQAQRERDMTLVKNNTQAMKDVSASTKDLTEVVWKTYSHVAVLQAEVDNIKDRMKAP
jgi:hypothetical protein